MKRHHRYLVSLCKRGFAWLVILIAAGFPAARSLAEEVVVAQRDYVFALTQPGQVFQIQKSVDPQSGVVGLRSDSELINSPSDLQRLLNGERQALREKYGRISGRLRLVFDQLGDAESVDVTVHIARVPVQHPSKLQRDVNDLREHAVQATRRALLTDVPSLLQKYDLKGARRASESNFTVSLTRAKLAQMKAEPRIAAIELFVEERTTSNPLLSSLATSALNPGPHPAGATGVGVHAATFEHGIWNTVFNCMGGLVAGNIDLDDTANSHGQQTLLNVRHAAPDAVLYHRDEGAPSGNFCIADYDDPQDAQFLVDNAIETTSLSCSRGGDQNNFEFLLMDDFAYTYPFTTFVNPTANDGYDLKVNWEPYNALSVGNVVHFGEKHFKMAECTQARNPNPVSGPCVDGGTPPFCAGDREMPHLIAPGITPSTTTDPWLAMVDPCLPGSGVWCGTSHSAPTVNGIAASIISSDSRMEFWPERVRVALILTAHNVDLGHWEISTDGRDGAGTVSGTDAIAFARNHVTVFPDTQPPGGVEHGMATGTWSVADGMEPVELLIKVPDQIPRHEHLRVVLTWDSNPDLTTFTNELSDLDLLASTTPGVFDFLSVSYDNNVEILDMSGATLTPGATIPLRVTPWNINIPTTATAQFFYWSVGWTWVPDHAEFDPNTDGCVDDQDLSAVIDVMLGSQPTERSFDLNGEGHIDVADARYAATLFTNSRGGVCAP